MSPFFFIPCRTHPSPASVPSWLDPKSIQVEEEIGKEASRLQETEHLAESFQNIRTSRIRRLILVSGIRGGKIQNAVVHISHIPAGM